MTRSPHLAPLRPALAFALLAHGVLLLLACADDRDTGGSAPAAIDGARDWPQLGQGSGHQGTTAVVGQEAGRILAELVTDPNASAIRAESGDSLLAHYPAPLLAGDEVYVAVKGGAYVRCQPPGSGQPAPCGADAWGQQTWSYRRLDWEGDALVTRWTFASDWEPPPNGPALNRWEPIFHATLAGDFLYVPGFAGTVHKVARASGQAVARIDPFGGLDPAIFVAGPVVADPAGNIYYNALRLDLADPWRRDAQGAWLVRIGGDDRSARVAFAELVPGAPAAGAACEGEFAAAQLPWPPATGAQPPAAPCGSQRPGINVAPAIAADGTVYSISRAHLNSRYGYLVAVNSDLTPRWAASLRDRLADGCGSPLLPPSGAPGGCRAGASPGVDPATNRAPAGRVVDTSSSSPAVAPDGSVLYGAFTRYNYLRGHLMRFGPGGDFLAAYDFGWDITPAIWRHGASWSAVVKDNRYPAGSYCSSAPHCPPQAASYRLTQLSPALVPEWSYLHTNPESCVRGAGGVPQCVADHPEGFEWCINAPAVDAAGRVYGNAEDGRVYVIDQGGVERASIFLDSALGAAYTPLSLDRAGRIYAQNNGRLFVVGR